MIPTPILKHGMIYMEYKYKVSVIVPIYNVEKYIRRAVDSLIAQTLKEIEIILVDDGSPDNCGTIIDKYTSQHENIVALHKENGGLSDARNAGMTVAHGEYIGFVDPDDYIEPDMFEALYQTIKRTQTDMCLCGYIEEFTSDYKLDRDIELPEIGTSEDLTKSFIFGGFGAYAWNKLYKRVVIEKHHLQYPVGIALVEDCAFLCEYLKYIKSYSVISRCLYHYIRNDSSICARYHDQQFEYYRYGNESKKRLIASINESDRDILYVENDKTFLNTCFTVIDQLNSFSNKKKMKYRYSELKRISSDEEFVALAKKHGMFSENRELKMKSTWVCEKKYTRFLIFESWKQRVIARIHYYIK